MREHHDRVALDHEATETLLQFVLRKARSALQFGAGTQMIISEIDRMARQRFPKRDWSREYLRADDLQTLEREGFSLRMPSDRECRKHLRETVYGRPKRLKKWRVW